MIDGQLSKEQVLELYLNRIYLSAGVYGVETMSRHLFGRPAKQLNLAECALIAGLARAPSTLSPWSNLDGALERSHVVLDAGCARKASSPRPRSGRRDGRASASVRIPARAIRAAATRRSILRQLFRERFGGDHPPDWEVRTTFVPTLQEAAEQVVRSGLARFNEPRSAGGARRDRSAHRQHPGARRRARLRAVAVQSRAAAAGVSRARRSSRSCSRPRSRTGTRRSRSSRG